MLRFEIVKIISRTTFFIFWWKKASKAVDNWNKLCYNAMDKNRIAVEG